MISVGTKVKINCENVEYPSGVVLSTVLDGFFQQKIAKIYLIELLDGRKLQVSESLLSILD